LQNKASSRSGTLLNAAGGSLGTVRAGKLLYATMTGTDVSLYQLTDTFASIKTKFNSTALTIASSKAANGSAINIPSSYRKQEWNCTINGFVPTLREDVWTFHDSIRYNLGCSTTHGTSGSPIISASSGQLVGINNTGNDNGEMCTLNNPCEVDENGNTTATKGLSYGQQTYWFDTCLSSGNQIDLTVAGCLLTKPAGNGNTVWVTDPGSQTGVVGPATSLQIQATDSASGQTLSYSAAGLPAGLAINASNGLISGTPTAAGTSNVTVTVKDTTNASGSASFSWTISGSGWTATAPPTPTR
jgi:hypothetical protein